MCLRNIFILLSLFISSVAFSQNSMVDKLQSRKAGEGMVTIHHDAQINALIGNNQNKNTTRPVKPNNLNITVTDDSAQDNVQSTADRKTIKVRGYRIQVYAGNNSRVARNEASNMANKVKSEFPELAVYTYFMPPRWLSRVGDFRSIEEADVMMRKMKATGLFKEVSIVKEQINIPID